MTMIPLILTLGTLLLAESGEPAAPVLVSETQTHMGTKFTLQVYAPTRDAAQPALAAAFARIAECDRIMSDYDPQSELSRLCASAPHAEPVAISPDLWKILRHARYVSHISDGAFDVTVGPLTRLWRQARRQKKLPDPERLRQAMAAIGYEHLEISQPRKTAFPMTAQLKKPGMRIDLGGIGQGYAAAAALKILKEHGFSQALVNASGDLVAGDPPPGQRGWKIALTGLDPGEPTQFVHLANGSLSTSGDAFQFVEVEGKRYSHIVDPETGIGLTTRMSVTVWHPDGTTADALASAVSVLGPEKGLQLVERLPNCAALLVVATDDGTKTLKSSRFDAILPFSRSSP